MPPALLQCSRLFKLQVGASLAGGGAWTPVSPARDSLAVQEGRVKSTRRRKSAALGSPSSGSPTAHRGHRGPSTAVRQVERWGPRRGGGAAWTWSASAGDPQSAHLPLSCGARVSARPPGAPTSARLARGRRRGTAVADAAALQSQVFARPKLAGFSIPSRFPSRGPSRAPGRRRCERGAESGPPPRLPPGTCCAPSERVSSGHVSGGQVQRPQTCPPEPGGAGLCAARALTQVSVGPGAEARPSCVSGCRPREGQLSLGGLAEVSLGVSSVRCSRWRGGGSRTTHFQNRMLWTPGSRRWESGPTRARLTHPFQKTPL